MLYHVTVAGRTAEVEIADGRVTVDGVAVSNAEMLGLHRTGVHHLIVDGEARAVLAHSASAGVWELHIEGRRMNAEVVDERTRAIRAMTRSASGPTGPRPVKAPMPGLVVRVEVNVGDTVTAGQGVLIMEAMKMENELKADAGGVVTKIHATAGQAVEKGAVLIEFAMTAESNG